MMQPEQILFTDRSVYISNTRLVLRKGGIYSIANLSQVAAGRMTGRTWIAPLLVGPLFLVLGLFLDLNTDLAKYSVVFNGEFSLLIGGALLLLSVASAVFQQVCPLYAVVLTGTFGTQRPIKRRNRRYIIALITALNQALSHRVGPTIVHTTQIGQLVQDWSHRSRDIVIGAGAQANIGTSGNAHNVHHAPGTGQWMDGSYGPNDGGMHVPGIGSRPDAWHMQDTGNITHGAIPPPPPGAPVLPADQPTMMSTRTRNIIISYSHEDRRWLDMLRTHLAVLAHQHRIVLWDDTQIAPGTPTEQATHDALNNADIVLLLVSAHFLGSEAMMNYELPQILERHAQRQLTLLPLVLSPCMYNESPLGRFRPYNPETPLSRLASPERDAMLVHLGRVIQSR